MYRLAAPAAPEEATEEDELLDELREDQSGDDEVTLDEAA